MPVLQHILPCWRPTSCAAWSYQHCGCRYVGRYSILNLIWNRIKLVRDIVFTAAKRRESEEILDKKDIPYQINVFSDVEHGFAMRCNLSEPRQKFAKEQAFTQAVNWLDEYVKMRKWISY